MKRSFVWLLIYLPVCKTFAATTFKQPLAVPYNKFAYIAVFIALLLVFLLLLKKNRFAVQSASSCKVIEKKYLGNKTLLYVIAYQEQHFLLADNQHALALHPLATGDSHAP